MKVLFCTPYEQKPGVVMGGINIWGHNIIEYRKKITSTTVLFPISYDRVFNVQEGTRTITRILNGVTDYWNSIKRTRTVLNEDNIDILHLCTSAQLGLFKDFYVLKMARRKRVKTVIHFHFGRIPEILKAHNWEGRMIMKVCNQADSIIVMDQNSFDVLLNRGFKNVFYLPNPLSIEIVNQVDSLSGYITRQKNKILYVGHILPTKGVYELVKACRAVPKIELHLIGTVDDSIKEELTSIAHSDGDGGWFHIRGSLSHQQVVKEMLSAGIFVLPSYTEGFPNVILESMACGCAIIATSVGAIPEILRFGEMNVCGIRVAVKDVQSITQSIIKLLDDYNLAEEIGKNARIRVLSTYSMPVVWNQIENIWQKTIME